MPDLPPTPPPIPLENSVKTESRAGKGFMAVCGTFVFWGLGHWIAGRRRRAAGWFVAWLVCAAPTALVLPFPSWLPALIVLGPLTVLLLIAATVDAFIVGRRSERFLLGRPWQRYLGGVALLGIAWSIGHIEQVLVRGWEEGFVFASSSMAPTLLPGDRVNAYKRLAVRRWDLVVFHPPPQPQTFFIFRIVGLPGEKVEIAGGEVRINNVPMSPPYNQWNVAQISGGNGYNGNPIVLGPDEYFVLGDNSPIAYDSRLWGIAAPGHQPGAVPRDSIVGRVTAIYWPISRWRMFR